ncbi:MAG: hypothetical protein LBK99_02485 [Opitutaceae bacterium]|jgi:hypothetical protein|nr:hypothetical protein [Opitutaceae bacterium]
MKITKLTPALARLAHLALLVALFPLFSPLLFSPLAAQTVAYDFNNQPGRISAATPSIVATGFASTISLVGYNDVTGSTATSVQWQHHLASLNTGRYLQISITNATDAFTLTNFAFTPMSFRAAVSAQIEVRFSTKSGTDFDTDCVTVWSSTTRYTAGGTAVSIALTDPAILAKIQNITTGYFRIYTFDPWSTSSGTADTGSWLGVDDIKITATTTAVPEPATAAAILGIVAITGMAMHRRLHSRQ